MSPQWVSVINRHVAQTRCYSWSQQCHVAMIWRIHITRCVWYKLLCNFLFLDFQVTAASYFRLNLWPFYFFPVLSSQRCRFSPVHIKWFVKVFFLLNCEEHFSQYCKHDQNVWAVVAGGFDPSWLNPWWVLHWSLVQPALNPDLPWLLGFFFV